MPASIFCVSCDSHINVQHKTMSEIIPPQQRRASDKTVESLNLKATRRSSDVLMSQLYPKYYKLVPAGVLELDIYAVCKMFPVADDSGAINHARKKLLVPGTRTGGKSFRDDIKEARDTLSRWLELNPE